MKITFDQVQDINMQGKGGAEKPQISGRDTEKRAESAGAYSVDIGARDRKAQTGTYKKDGMTAEDISMQAGQMDVDVQKMYMAVMSNSMSEEDFHKMLEDGYSVSDTDIETMVTILDRIKVAVAKGGGEIEGFTDKLSGETLEEILGSPAYAEALQDGLEEGAAAYMVGKQMPPTAENIYKAKYSAGVYRQEKDAEVPERESAEGKAFWEQIDRVIREAGLPENGESRADAAFLLKYDIPLTEENLLLYERIKPFGKDAERLSEEELKRRIAIQAYEGKPAFQADLSRAESVYEEAANLYEAVRELPPDAAERAVREHDGKRELTLRDILESGSEEKKNEAQIAGSGGKLPASRGDDAGAEPEKIPDSRELLTARRQLEEVRLRMTVEANVKLLRSGFQIDTARMEELIERLRAAEEAFAEQGITQAAEASEKIEALRGMPMAVLGFVVSREISFTIEALHEKGSELQGDFERADAEQVRRQTAGRRYETMQTEVRADLGDSIRKAFRNVDDILTDMNREPSEENRRAVRMLGYNRLEISGENLNRALEIDEKVQRLFRDMKPGRVLQMIRDGVDVLHTDIEELDAYLTEQSGSFMEESGDFARFLHKLDKSGGLTAEERENYIGIYRLVRQVEKSDGRAQGYLLGSEAELTMANLLSAVRSGRRGAMDYRIDGEFSGVDALQRGKSILEQINAVSYEDPAGYEETMQALEGAAKNMRQGGKEGADFLQEVNEPVTVSNLVEASSVLQEDAGIYQRIEEYEREADREERLEAEQSRFESYVEGLQDAVTDEESLKQGMEVFAERAEEILREAESREGVTELDIRELQRLYRGIRFRTVLSREARYQIPVKLDTGFTVMNLTVRRGIGSAQAEISMETEKFGKLEAVFTGSEEMQAAEAGESGGMKEGEEARAAVTSGITVSGSFFAETEGGADLLQGAADRVRERLRNAGIPAKDITVLQGNRVRSGAGALQTGGAAGRALGNGTSELKTGQKEISTGELYQIAKIFLETVRNEW